MKKTWYCAQCGSREIYHHAVAQWNAETEDFDTVDVLDDTWCNRCSEKDLYEKGEPTFGIPPEETKDAKA